VTHDLSQYLAARASGEGTALLAVQNLWLSSAQVPSPGSKSGGQALSAENQAQNGVEGLAWTLRERSSTEPSPTRAGSSAKWNRTEPTSGCCWAKTHPNTSLNWPYRRAVISSRALSVQVSLPGICHVVFEPPVLIRNFRQ